MKHYYSTVNNVVLSHSDMIATDFERTVYVRLERRSDNGLDFAECTLPFISLYETNGFSEEELGELADYVFITRCLYESMLRRSAGKAFCVNNMI